MYLCCAKMPLCAHRWLHRSLRRQHRHRQQSLLFRKTHYADASASAAAAICGRRLSRNYARDARTDSNRNGLFAVRSAQRSTITTSNRQQLDGSSMRRTHVHNPVPAQSPFITDPEIKPIPICASTGGSTAVAIANDLTAAHNVVHTARLSRMIYDDRFCAHNMCNIIGCIDGCGPFGVCREIPVADHAM